MVTATTATAGGRGRRSMIAAAIGLCLASALLAVPAPLRAQDAAPYDDQLMRLAEILGALHHLRPLCGADETQVWRDQMSALLAAEQPSAERRRKLTDRFNRSYTGLAETHRTCSPAARTLIERYTAEGAALAGEVVVRWGRS
jgi:uncharacterized protein (TIGR02301 family)